MTKPYIDESDNNCHITSPTTKRDGMKEALIINVLILILIGLVIVMTQNPLALICVLLLREMPYGLIAGDDDDEEDEKDPGYENRKIGFHVEE